MVSVWPPPPVAARLFPTSKATSLPSRRRLLTTLVLPSLPVRRSDDDGDTAEERKVLASVIALPRSPKYCALRFAAACSVRAVISRLSRCASMSR